MKRCVVEKEQVCRDTCVSKNGATVRVASLAFDLVILLSLQLCKNFWRTNYNQNRRIHLDAHGPLFLILMSIMMKNYSGQYFNLEIFHLSRTHQVWINDGFYEGNPLVIDQCSWHCINAVKLMDG